MRGGPYAAIALAVVSVSFASIFITWSDSPPITIALYRLAIATGIVGATILIRSSALRKPNTLLRIPRRDAALMALIGAILATHFALWISSLKVEGESIASSVVLVTSHPLMVGLLSHYVLRERLNRWMAVGIVLGFAGVVSIALADYGFAGSLLYADILAFSGGVMAGFYFLLGRRVRQRVALLDYAFVVYASATAVLFVYALAFGSSLAPLGDTPRELLLFAAFAVVPQIGGQTLYNLAFRSATRSQIVPATALPFELLRVEFLEPLVCVDVLRLFVVSNPHNPCEAKCETARVMRAPLDLVVRDLGHGLGSHMESPALLGRREAAQPLRHRLELRIREALERLPDHLEAAALVVAHGEPVVRQPAFPPAASPFGRGDREVEVVRRLDLEPLLASLPNGVRRLELLRHQPFVSGDEGLLEEGLDLVLPLRDPAGRQQLRGHEPFEDLPSLPVRRVDQRSAIEVEHVEEIQLQRNLFRGRLDPVHASEAAHEVLERERLSVLVHRDDLAFEQEFGRGQ